MAALQHATEQLTTRYQILVSAIRNGPAGPEVILGAAKPPVVEDYDVSTEVDTNRESKARAIATEVLCRAFDTESGPLFRICCITITPREFVVGFVIHHLFCDMISLKIITSELMSLYGAFLHSRAMPLPPAPMGYGDYLQGIWGWLETAAAEAARNYWVKTLRDSPPTKLAAEHDFSDRYDDDAQLQQFNIDMRVVQDLRLLVSQHKTSLFAIFLTAKILAISSISGSRDVTVAVMVTVRETPQLLRVVGWMNNQLPIRIQIGANDTFEDLLRKVEHSVAEARRHQFYPPSYVWAVMRDVSASFDHPLYNYKENAVSLPPGLAEKLGGFPIDFVNGTFVNGSHYFETVVSDDGISGYLRYSPKLYGRQVATAFVSLFAHILETAIGKPLQPALSFATADTVDIALWTTRGSKAQQALGFTDSAVSSGIL